VLPLVLIGWSARTLYHDINNELWVHGTFAAINLLMTTYACVVLVGIPGILIDIFMSIREFLYRDNKKTEDAVDVPYWASVLYVGASVPEEIERHSAVAVALAAEDRFNAENPQMSEVAQRG
jgi:hypothetical protein